MGAAAKGDVGVGIGANVDGDIGIKNGKFDCKIGGGAYLGVGGNFDLSFSVDVPQAVQDAAPVVSNTEKAVGGFASTMTNDASQFLNLFHA